MPAVLLARWPKTAAFEPLLDGAEDQRPNLSDPGNATRLKALALSGEHEAAGQAASKAF